ncbi:HEAT repeat domain-containing protein [Maribacter hydrothermalis]|uniref:HEAT repeat-containing protein n=1 Tax=Maribacter hydrothermalis TaxID=1836467 RepID=A0A1B7Z8K8_9FLAO|nr:HEAT repeat domain-containing protein [Maribacter hydrothermalis]APQ18940.1 hypothetical protein BTR34_17140 [Maribacter hydrothermalis]OBR39047.1 hypothetical protein A9200_05135 [Maribacter hydrothermalis]
MSSSSGRTKEKKIEFSPMISEFLFFEDTDKKEDKMNYLNLKIQIRELIKNSFDRAVLTEVLLDLRKDLSGQSQTVLIELYKDLGLHNDAYYKLSSRRWQIVSSGILELTTMEVDESYSRILKFINHRQSTIRKQAEIAIVNLKEEGIVYFLDNTRYKISEWQQLKLLDVLRHKPDFEPPKFGLWLTSTNAHVVLFALRLIKFYSQSDAEQSIITLLKHKNRAIQTEAIDCIKQFYFKSALPTLKLVYTKASNDVKIIILDTIGEIGSAIDVAFLESLTKKERNFNIKSKVFGTLNKLDPECILPTKNVSKPDFFIVEPSANEVDIELLDTINTDELTDSTIDTASNSSITEVPVQPKELVDSDLKEKIVGNLSDDIKEQPVIENKEELSEVGLNSLEEEVTDSELNVDKYSIENVDLTFLPNVYDDSIENDNKNEPIKQTAKIDNELTFDFLPIVVEPILIEKIITTEEFNDFSSIFSLDEDIEIENNQQHNLVETEIETELADLDWNIIIDNNSNLISKQVTNAEECVVNFENDTISFSANFVDQEELDTMVLLENIAEMGDCRELPVLQDIIIQNNSELILNRANELIKRFSYQSPRPNQLFSSESDLAESVFTEIFKLADTETKLVLLKEIKRIGDVKEIHLLETVIQTESKFLVKKAKAILKEIQSKIIVSETDLSGSKEKEDAIFKVNFELGSREFSNKILKSNSNGSTLFDQLCSMSNSLYNKLNG